MRSLITKVIKGYLISLLFLSSVVLGASLSPELLREAEGLSDRQRAQLVDRLGLVTNPIKHSPTGIVQPEEAVPLKKPTIEETDLTNETLSEDYPKKPPIFGARLFAAQDSIYERDESALVPQNYLLGPGDRLLFTFFGTNSGQYEVLVEQDGSLVVPSLGLLSVAGLTYVEFKEYVKGVAAERVIGTDVFVSPVGLRRINVSVVGEVVKPGIFNLSALSGVLDLLYLAGGPTEIGSFRRIKLNTLDGATKDIDLYDLLIEGNSLKEALRDGDTVFVPPLGAQVTVQGEVLRPARYEISGNTTISELIRIAGGVTSTAYSKGVVLRRFDSRVGSPKIIQVDGFDSSLVLRNGDEIFIRPGSNQPSNLITISGAVAQPGTYEYRAGLRVGDYLPSLDANFLPNSDLEIGLILRREDLSTDIEVLSFDPVLSTQKVETSFNPLLQPRDEIIILPTENLEEIQEQIPFFERLSVDQNTVGAKSESNDFEASDRMLIIRNIVDRLRSQAEPGELTKTVSIFGAVNNPGVYPLPKADESFARLLKMSGGVKDGAYLGRVELRRRSIQSNRAVNSIEVIDISQEKSFPVRPADEIRVNFLPGWRERETATVLGEVEFPGEYVLTPEETVSSLIARAGGFTREAFVQATRFRSKAARERQRESVLSALRDAQRFAEPTAATTSVADLEGNQYFDESDVSAMQFEGRVIVDIPRILSGDESSDLAVQEGDSIFVPRIDNVVTVVGEVLRPGNYRHVDGTSFEQYIDLAAGYTVTAQKKRAYMILPSGRVQRHADKASIFTFSEPREDVVAGTTIVVPPNPDYAKPLDFYSQVSNVVFQSMASIAAFFSIARN